MTNAPQRHALTYALSVLRPTWQPARLRCARVAVNNAQTQNSAHFLHAPPPPEHCVWLLCLSAVSGRCVWLVRQAFRPSAGRERAGRGPVTVFGFLQVSRLCCSDGDVPTCTCGVARPEALDSHRAHPQIVAVCGSNLFWACFLAVCCKVVPARFLSRSFEHNCVEQKMLHCISRVVAKTPEDLHVVIFCCAGNDVCSFFRMTKYDKTHQLHTKKRAT